MKLATNSKVFLALLLLISFTTVSVASEPTVAKLNKGDKVPFQAWCFNIPAAAKLIADKETAQERCQLEISKALEKQKADYDLKIDYLNAYIKYEKDVSSKVMEALEIENQELEEIALKRSNDYWYLFAGGGVVVGILTTVLVVHAVQ